MCVGAALAAIIAAKGERNCKHTDLRQLAKNKQPHPTILTTQQPKMERR